MRSDLEYWAKTDVDGKPALSVVAHCANVGAVAVALSDRIPRPIKSLALEGMPTLAALHDIGKLSAGFQSKCEKWFLDLGLTKLEEREWKTSCGNHAAVSQMILGALAFHGDSELAKWTIPAGGHHGFFPFPARPRPRVSDHVSEQFGEARRALLDQMIAEFGPLPAQPLLHVDHMLWATGFITLADWIGSDERVFPLYGESDAANASQAVANLDIGSGNPRPAVGFQDLFPFAPNKLQETLLTAATEPGLYIVEAPMGEGKTEAALAAAHQLWTEGHHHGLYFGLPTQLTSERIHERMNAFLAKAVVSDGARLTLVHGQAWLRENLRILDVGQASPKPDTKNELIDARYWFTSSRRPLLAPFGAGTVDQALMASMPLKHAGLRLFALSGKVVVLDEVHSFDPYTSGLIDALIGRLLNLNCSVIILSATLTQQRRCELLQSAGVGEPTLSGAYPVVTAARSGLAQEFPFDASAEHRREVAIRHRDPDDVVLWEDLADAAQNGANVLVVRNTVALAQKTYGFLKSNCREGIEVGLLHSRFTPQDRAKIEGKWLKALGKDSESRKGCILVSTQICEQSVDIDADLLVTDLAPTELLIQRLGRLHRHRQHDANRPADFSEPQVILLDPLDGSEEGANEIRSNLSPHSFIYPPYALVRASALWRERSSIALPSEIRDFLETTYDTSSDQESWTELKKLLDEETRDQTGAAKSRANPLVDLTIHDSENNERFGTRWKTQPTALLVMAKKVPSYAGEQLELIDGTLHDVSAHEWSIDLARAFHNNAVKLPRWQVVPSLIEVPTWLSLHMQDATIAVVENGRILFDESLEMPGLLGYDARQGASFDRAEGPAISSSNFEPFEEDGWF